MIATFAAVVLAVLGAAAMAASGQEYAKGNTFHFEGYLGLSLIALALVLVAS